MLSNSGGSYKNLELGFFSNYSN